MTDENPPGADDAPEQSSRPLDAELAAMLEGTAGRTDELAREHPVVVADVVDALHRIDIAEFVADHPTAAARLQELLWTGLCEAARGDALDEITETITVTVAADDCSLAGHLAVDGAAGTVAGGPGRADDANVAITGPADVLVGLLAGDVDPTQGYLRGQFAIEGPVGRAMALAPVMAGFAERLSE